MKSSAFQIAKLFWVPPHLFDLPGSQTPLVFVYITHLQLAVLQDIYIIFYII